LPFADLPQQVAAIGILQHWWDASWRLHDFYTLNIGDSQYVLYHLLGALLSLVVRDAETANRLLLTFVAVAYPLSSRELLRALGRDERLAAFGVPMFWSAPLLMGFLPYVASVPVAVLGIAIVVRHSQSRTKRRFFSIAVVGVALFAMHVSAYLVFVATSAVVALLLARASSWRTLAALVPSIALALAWAARGALSGPVAAHDAALVHFLSIREHIDALPVWAHDIWRSKIDEACAMGHWAAFVALLFQRRQAPEDRALARAALVPFAIALLAYLLLPYNVGPASMLDLRMATFVVLFAPLVLTPHRGWRGALPLAVVVMSSAVGLVNSAFELRSTEREELGDIDRLIDRIPPGTRVLTLPFHLASSHTHWPPWTFLGSYHVARAGGFAAMSFTELRHWPIRDRSDHAAPAPSSHRAFWTLAPCEFRNARDGENLDYVLSRGTTDPFASQPPGPQWRALDHEREWTLFERVPDAFWPARDDTDPGPCPTANAHSQ
jgi:hypothetical protein